LPSWLQPFGACISASWPNIKPHATFSELSNAACQTRSSFKISYSCCLAARLTFSFTYQLDSSTKHAAKPQKHTATAGTLLRKTLCRKPNHPEFVDISHLEAAPLIWSTQLDSTSLKLQFQAMQLRGSVLDAFPLDWIRPLFV
jgi:hypothetical protein